MQRLSEKEMLILSATALDADLPHQEVANRAGCSVGTVRQVLKSLLERRLIEPRNYIDVFRLNLASYVMLFSLDSKQVVKRPELIEALSSLPGTVWFAEVGGDYEFVLNICQGNVHQLLGKVDEIGLRFGNIFSRKIIAQHSMYRDYSYGFLTPEKLQRDWVGTEHQQPILDFDETDHRVLSAIAAYPLSQREVARRLGLPASTVQYRMERLKDLGIWKRTIYLVNHTALGYDFALLLLYAKTSSADLRKRVHEFCQRNPNVVTLTESIGAWDFELSAIGEHSNDIKHLRDSLLQTFTDELHLVSCIPCYRLLKWNQYPFEAFDDYQESLEMRPREKRAARAGAQKALPPFYPETMR